MSEGNTTKVGDQILNMGPAPLDEEAEAPEYAPEIRSANDPTHRRLQAIAGADVAYVFLTFPDGTVTFDTNTNMHELAAVLRQVAEALQ